jgi:hypothetical protein
MFSSAHEHWFPLSKSHYSVLGDLQSPYFYFAFSDNQRNIVLNFGFMVLPFFIPEATKLQYKINLNHFISITFF